jgi:multiple sugar transport system permease protein
VNWVLQALHMGFFKSIPKDIEEAAMVDGCGRARAIVQIIMPISLAGILSAVIFAFTLTIQEFTYALTLITSSGQQTVGVGVPTFLDRFISGFTVGAIK